MLGGGGGWNEREGMQGGREPSEPAVLAHEIGVSHAVEPHQHVPFGAHGVEVVH
jgi:hypothetical protein